LEILERYVDRNSGGTIHLLGAYHASDLDEVLLGATKYCTVSVNVVL
jgi:hypothetical protein